MSDYVDYALSAPDEATMQAGLAPLMYNFGNYIYDGIVPGGGRFRLRVRGLLALPIPKVVTAAPTPGVFDANEGPQNEYPEIEETRSDPEPDIEVPVYGTPLFWVKVTWMSDQNVPAWTGLSVYSSQNGASIPPVGADIL